MSELTTHAHLPTSPYSHSPTHASTQIARGIGEEFGPGGAKGVSMDLVALQKAKPLLLNAVTEAKAAIDEIIAAKLPPPCVANGWYVTASSSLCVLSTCGV
jgi:hypothetical protein